MSDKLGEKEHKVMNDNSREDKLQEGLQPGDVGDVETAGETTAAATAGGSSNESPVGADTLVKTQGEPDAEEGKSR